MDLLSAPGLNTASHVLIRLVSAPSENEGRAVTLLFPETELAPKFLGLQTAPP